MGKRTIEPAAACAPPARLPVREGNRIADYLRAEPKMRNVILAINITLDGCCDHTKGIADDEIHEYFTHLMRDVDLLAFGPKTYQLMVPFWPDVAKAEGAPSLCLPNLETQGGDVDFRSSRETPKVKVPTLSLQNRERQGWGTLGLSIDCHTIPQFEYSILNRQCSFVTDINSLWT
jgi:hypothetical protein